MTLDEQYADALSSYKEHRAECRRCRRNDIKPDPYYCCETRAELFGRLDHVQSLIAAEEGVKYL